MATQRVPVVRRADHDRVDVLAVEQLAEVRELACSPARSCLRRLLAVRRSTSQTATTCTPFCAVDRRGCRPGPAGTRPREPPGPMQAMLIRSFARDLFGRSASRSSSAATASLRVPRRQRRQREPCDRTARNSRRERSVSFTLSSKTVDPYSSHLPR